MANLVEILCILEEEIGLVCWQLLHNMYAMKIFGIQPTCELSLFSFKLSKRVRYFYYLWEAKSIWKKSKLLKQLFDALDDHAEIFYLNFSVANMAGNETQRELQTMI